MKYIVMNTYCIAINCFQTSLFRWEVKWNGPFHWKFRAMNLVFYQGNGTMQISLFSQVKFRVERTVQCDFLAEQTIFLYKPKSVFDLIWFSANRGYVLKYITYVNEKSKRTSVN